MLKFLHTRIWAHLPNTVSRRTRLLAALLWAGALILYGILVAHHRSRLGIPPGHRPHIAVALGVIVGLILLTPQLGGKFYLATLRVFAIPGFFISLLILVIGFYLVITPMGLLLRLTGKDLLRTGKKTPPQWLPHPGQPNRSRFYRLS